MLTEEKVNQLKEIKGKVRGAVFQTDASYIQSHFGAGGLELLAARLRELSCPIEYENIKAMEWLPLWQRAVSMLLIKELFQLSDEDIKEMGIAAPRTSFIVKLLVKFFISLESALGRSPDYWVKHYNVGELEVVKIDEEERRIIVRLKDFRVDPVYCRYLEGYFQSLIQLQIPKSRVVMEEVKCIFRGDPYHEFRARW